MFEHYSKPALEVVFTARFKAGERGSDAMDVGDLLVALVIEDQGRMREILSQDLPENAVFDGVYPSHPAFVEPQTATRLLLNVEALLMHSTPVPTHKDLPITAGLYLPHGVARQGIAHDSSRRQRVPRLADLRRFRTNLNRYSATDVPARSHRRRPGFKAFTPWTRPPSIYVCRCSRGPSFASTKPPSRCTRCWTCTATSPRLSASPAELCMT